MNRNKSSRPQPEAVKTERVLSPAARAKRNTALRALLPFAVLFASGILFWLFGYRTGSGSPTTAQLISSLIWCALTLLAWLILGIVKKSGFLYALAAFLVLAFPPLPFSGAFGSPLYALTHALAVQPLSLYVLYAAAALLLFGAGTGIRILINKLFQNGSPVNLEDLLAGLMAKK